MNMNRKMGGFRQNLVLIWATDTLQGDYLSQIYTEAGFKVSLVTGYQALRDSLAELRHLPVLILIGRFDRLQQLKSLQTLAPLASLLILTPQQDLDAGLDMLAAGADAYLMQPVQPEQLIAESLALLRHSRRILRHFGSLRAEAVQRFGPLSLFPERSEAELAGHKLDLNGRQFKLLHFFCLHANKSVRREQIAQILDTGQQRSSPRQLDNLVMTLRRALSDEPDVKIETRYGEGYVLKIKLLE